MADFQPIACSFTIPPSEHRNNTGTRERQTCVPDVSDIPFIYNARFAELVRTNDPPEAADLHFLNTSLENARSISATINKGILVIQRVMEELESANAAILTAITRHQEILSPLRPIPDDIILAIFQWCSSSANQEVDSLSSSRAPWTLSHVSRRWRNLVVSSPRLWSNINIVSREPHTSISKRDRMVFNLGLYLRRSIECDLFINITSDPLLDEYLALLLPTAHRWRRLSLAVHTTALALQLAECRFERLIEMVIHFGEPTPQLVLHVPNIRDLSVSGYRFEAVDFPWESITSYTCDQNGLWHLPKLSALQHFAVVCFGDIIPILTSLGASSPLTLPALRSISMVGWFNRTGLEKLSDYLLLPSLTTLTINMSSQDWKFPRFNGSICHLHNLLINSDITSGWIEVSAADKSELRSFLAECASVTALYLNMYIWREEVLHTLADKYALPKLTSLRVAVQLMRGCPGLVLDLIESRAKVAPLTELWIVEVEDIVEAHEWQGDWMEAKTVTGDIVERWNLICSKMNVFAVVENVF